MQVDVISFGCKTVVVDFFQNSNAMKTSLTFAI